MRIPSYSGLQAPVQLRPMPIRQANVAFAGDAPKEKKEGGLSGLWHRWVYNPRSFKRPFPISPVMTFSTHFNRYMMLGEKGVTKIKEIDLPETDANRLKTVLQKQHAVFLGPNHPEFLTDWMIDKELTSRFAPKVASWADWSLTNNMLGFGTRVLFNWFWRANNLIANVSKGDSATSPAQEYSKEWAQKGHGVLLHPEGTVHWTGDRVQHVFDGIASMPLDVAIAQAKAGKKPQPSFAVPLIWKLEFTGDVTEGLKTEIAGISKLVKVPVDSNASVSEQFFGLQRGILARSEEKFLPAELRQTPVSNENYFDRQDQLFNHLAQDLEGRYGHQEGTGKGWLNKITKAIKASKDVASEQKGSDLKKADELLRLLGFTREIYNTPNLTQENIAESLKRILSAKGSTLQKLFPVPVGPRIAHVRVAEPLEVSQYVNADGSTNITIPELVATIRKRMQDKIDEVNTQIAPSVGRYQVANAFYKAPAQSSTATL